MTAPIPALNPNVIFYVYQREQITIHASVLKVYERSGVHANAPLGKPWLE